MTYDIMVFWDFESSQYAQERGSEAAYQYYINNDTDWSLETYNFKTKEELDAFKMGIAESKGWNEPYYE